MRKKVLIYVQAYNAEKTLERCLKSIEMQTYKEFECVIYDNGSKDDTEKIANRFSEKDGRFIVVHRDENDTTLFFRYFVPLFVEKYTGIIDYFCNLDSDDEYKADFLEKSITFLEKNELDLVASGGDFIDANTGKCVSKREVEQDLIIEDENFGSYFPIYHQFMRTIWGKLYRFSLLGKIDCERCMCMAYGGDTFFVFNILHFCKRIGIMNKNLHKYYMSLKSSSYTFSEKRIESDTKLLQEAITFLVYKVGYVSPMNQNFLMQVYKNAISDTIEVLFDSTEKERLSPLFRLGSQLFLDLGALAHAAAQIVQLGTPHSTVADHLDLVDGGRVHGEDLLHTDTVGDAAHGDGLGDAAVLLGDDGALEDLDTLAVAFLDLDVHPHGVAHLYDGGLSLQVLLSKSLHEIHNDSSCLYRRSCRHVCGVRLVPDTGGRGPPFLCHDRISHPSRFCKHFLRFP